MNWFRENKFAGILFIVTALLIGAAVAVGLSFQSKSSLAREEFESAKDSISKHKKVKPYPTQENLEKREQEGFAFRGQIEALQSALIAYRPGDLSPVPVNIFTDRLKSIDTDLRVLFADAGVEVPEDFYVGFEKYSSAIPRKEATGILNYELNAIEWLLNQVAEAQVSSLVNLNREALPVESGVQKETVQELPGRAGSKQINPIEERLGVDLVVKGKEASLRKLLNLIASSEDYFFLTNGLSLKNEKTAAPNQNDVSFDSMEEESESGEFTFEDEEGEKSASSDAKSVEILKPVLGFEEVYLALNMDLVLFAKSEELPKVK